MSCLHLCFSFFFRELFWTLTACQTFSCFHDLLITFSIHLFLILLSSFPFLFISLTKIAFLLGFLFLKIRLKELSKGNVTEERLFLDFQIIMVFLFHLSFFHLLVKSLSSLSYQMFYDFSKDGLIISSLFTSFR